MERLSGMYKNSKKSQRGLPNPYWDIEASIRYSIGLPREDKRFRDEDFTGASYHLKALVEFLARRMRKQAVAARWQNISHIQNYESIPDSPNHFLLWHCEKGIFRNYFSEMRKSWKKLCEEASALETSMLPKALINT